jgi:hypothetical protein
MSGTGTKATWIHRAGRKVEVVGCGAKVGRQLGVALTHQDEQNLVDQLRKDGFVVVPERLPTPRLWEHVWEKLPLDDEADPWDYQCTIVPEILARTRQGHFVGLPSPLDKRPRGSIPTRLAYSANTMYFPSIEWDRNRRIGPKTLRIPGSGGRFYVDPRRDYGADEKWKEPVLTEYDKIVQLVKKWTVRRARWGYWSKQLDHRPPSDEDYRGLIERSSVTPEQREVCERFGVAPWPASKELKVEVARNVKPGSLPVNGRRRRPEGEMVGWYVWGGDQPPVDPDFFAPLHLEHLLEWCPKVWRYLALPPGWRFLIASDHEDVWRDPSLLQPEGAGLG